MKTYRDLLHALTDMPADALDQPIIVATPDGDIEQLEIGLIPFSQLKGLGDDYKNEYLANQYILDLSE